MSGKKCIFPGGAKPLYTYSPGVLVGNTLYLSGQIGVLEDGKTLAPTIEEQTRIALQKMGEILKEAGMGYEHVVTVDVLLSDIALITKMNDEYSKVFAKETAPARAAYAVKALPLGALVEIKAMACKH